MLRTILTIGLLVLLGLFVLKLVFGILPFVLGLVFWLLLLAVKIAILGLIAYLVIRLVSPETAQRLRDRFSSPRY